MAPISQLDDKDKVSFDGQRKRVSSLKKDTVIERKLRLLKENMIRSGNPEIAQIAEKTDFSDQENKKSTEFSKYGHSLKELDHLLPRSAVPWSHGAINTKNKKYKMNEK